MDHTTSQPVEFLSDEVPATSSSSDALAPTLRPYKSKQRRSYKCDTCDYTSVRLRDLKRHNKKPCKSGKSVKTSLHRCEHCDYKTRRHFNLKRHVRKFHALVWKCDYCDFTTEVCQELLHDHHQQVHQGLPFYGKSKSLRVSGEQPRLMMLPYTCGICYRGYFTEGSLTSHMKDNHKENSFVCPICDRIFSRKFDLKRHLKNVHRSSQAELCSLIDPVQQKYWWL